MSTLRYFIGLLAFATIWFAHSNAKAGDGGYRIEVELQNFNGDTLFLGYYFGKAQYLKDTAALSNGKFVFEGDEALTPGVYLLVIPPDNRFIHILVNDKHQHFSAAFDLEQIVAEARFKGCPENDIYYEYLRELEKRRPQADAIRKQIREDSLQVRAKELEKVLEVLDREVKKIQDKIAQDHPGTLTALLVKGSKEVVIPDFEGLEGDSLQQRQYEYYRDHYFDYIDWKDSRLNRTGMLHAKIDFFLQKLTYQVPDSQMVAMDYLLKKMDGNEELFQYYLVHFINEAAKSKRMGMDAVYVHLVDKYYAAGKAFWADQEQIDKLKSQADALRPTLIGQVAPNVRLNKESGETINVHDIDAEYTVLFFWDPECGHCKKAIPYIIEFYNQFKPRGVEILGICTKTGADISSCWSAVKEKGMDIWVNAADNFLRSRYKTLYDIKSTPQIFVLDKDKKIILKKLAGEDLSAVMEEVLKMNGH